MASDRISKQAAMEYWFPPFKMETMLMSELVAKDINKQEVAKRVPVNTPLLSSIEKEGILNPFLAMENYWCIAGQQRVKCAQEIMKKNPEWDCRISIYVITGRPWEPLMLWEDKEVLDKDTAVAIYFQMIELIFKSRYSIYDKDRAGNEMAWYEELGDRAEWNHD